MNRLWFSKLNTHTLQNSILSVRQSVHSEKPIEDYYNTRKSLETAVDYYFVRFCAYYNTQLGLNISFYSNNYNPER